MGTEWEATQKALSMFVALGNISFLPLHDEDALS